MENEQITSTEVGTALQFFEYFSQGMYGNNYLYNKFYTPDLINSAMKAINNNPTAPKQESDITNALANINQSEQILRNYATYFEINNMFYKRLINFNANLPAFNVTFDCINIEDEEEFKSEDFKKDLRIVDNFCSTQNLKGEFKKIVNQVLRQGAYFGVFRDEAEYHTWQELPIDFCKITGNSNVGKLFDFNFAYFINGTGSNIDMYPKIFKKLFREITHQVNEIYNPKGKVNTRHSSFVYWINLSPKNNFFCFTLDDNLTTLIPYYSALFPDFYIQPIMRNLEKNKAMISATKLLVNLIETYDTAKSGTVPNQYKITPKDIGQFMSLVKEALDGAIKAVAIPAKDAKVVDFNVEATSRYNTYQSTLANNSLSSSASMFAEDKLNAFEAQLALTIDQNFVKGFYHQFENFMNYYINNRTSKYKFKMILNDTNDNLDRDRRKNQFKELAMMGIVDFNLYARSTDQTIFQAKRALQLSKSMKIEDNLISLMSLSNQSSSGEVGRPTVSNSTNDSTIASQERATEILN